MARKTVKNKSKSASALAASKKRRRSPAVSRGAGVRHARKGWFLMAVDTAFEFSSQRRGELHGFLYTAMGLVLALTLIPSETNLLGPVGNYLFRMVFGAFGLSSGLLPVGLAIWGVSLMRGSEIHAPSIKALGWMLIAVALSLLLHLAAPEAISNGPAQGLYLAGLLGKTLGGSMQSYIAATGVLVLAGVLAGVALYLLEKESVVKNTVLQAYQRLRIGIQTGFKFWKERVASEEEVPLRLEKKSVSDQKRLAKIAEAAAKKLVTAKAEALEEAEAFVEDAELQEDEEDQEEEIDDPEETDTKIPSVMSSAADREAAAEMFLKKRQEIKVSEGGPKVNESASTAAIASVVAGGSDLSDYELPGADLLKTGGGAVAAPTDYAEISANLEKVLASFGVAAKVVEVCPGPAVTRYEIELSPGTKMSKVINLAGDIALGTKVSSVRIEGPIPGKGTLGVEIPNAKPLAVYLKELVSAEEFNLEGHKLIFAVGKDIGGSMIFANLAEMPHLLVAGATGAGKSVCLNGIISSILMRAAPDEVKMLMIDPKRVELTPYDNIPHLLRPVVTNPKHAAGALRLTVEEMEERYKLLASAGMRKIDDYNEWVDSLEEQKEGLEPLSEEELEEIPKEKPVYRRLPYIVVIVDELADLMMVSANEVESSIARLAQMARGVGIHLVIATQRPSVDVITGVIKANFPSRIAFQVSSKIDSRTILDASGAEALLGKGDMLFSPYNVNKPVRVQNCFISGAEVSKIVRHVKEQAEPTFDQRFEKIEEAPEGGKKGGSSAGSDDELYEEAVRQVLRAGQASTSVLQRRLKVGYGRAARLLDVMEDEGIIGPSDGNKPRKVLLNPEDYSDENQALSGSPDENF